MPDSLVVKRAGQIGGKKTAKRGAGYSDGKLIVYIVRENGAENLLEQPIDGGAGHLLTNFSSDVIQAFDYSLDGKNLAVLRSHTESDIVLLRDTSSR